MVSISNTIFWLAGPRKWTKIAEFVPNRAHVQCMQRWKHALDPNLTKGPWTSEEDDLLLRLKSESKTGNWTEIAGLMQDRNAKQCRERWNTVLDSSLKRTAWAPEEDKVDSQH
jgi:hypothetical protein